MRVLSLILLSTLMSGCVVWVEDSSDLQQFVQRTKARPAGLIEPLPDYKAYESFVYEGASLREPFVALQPMQAVGKIEEQDTSDNGIYPDESRIKAYLEDFSLDDLSMVGTINMRGSEKLWALVKDTRNAVHRVSVGDHMGLDFGEIVAIDERKIELVEIVANGRGGWMKRPRTLALNERGSGSR